MRALVMITILGTILSISLGSLTMTWACEESGNGNPNVSWKIRADRISVYDAGRLGVLMQEIPYNAAILPELDDLERVITEDLNFDGYLDLKIMTSRGNANVYYDCWLWEPVKRQFVQHQMLSALASPMFDPVHKTIHSFARNSAADSIEGTYVFEKEILRPMRIIERKYDSMANMLVSKTYCIDEAGEQVLVFEQHIVQEEESFSE